MSEEYCDCTYDHGKLMHTRCPVHFPENKAERERQANFIRSLEALSEETKARNFFERISEDIENMTPEEVLEHFGPMPTAGMDKLKLGMLAVMKKYKERQEASVRKDLFDRLQKRERDGIK